MASILKVDDLRGNTAAKTITVTVGATATQSLEHGLLKGFQSYDGDPLAIGDSLNTSSLTDNGTGQYQPNFTNLYSSTDYSNTHGAKYGGGNGWYHWYNTVETGAIDHNFITTGNAYADADHISGMQTGDLA